MLEACLTIWEALPYLLEGAVVTCALVLLGAMAVGLCLGVPLSVGEVSGPAWLSRLVGHYVWVLSGRAHVVL